MFKSLLKAAVGVVVTPVAVVADIATIGGLNTGAKEPYTASTVKSIGKNLADAIDPNK